MSGIFSDPLDETIEINDGETVIIQEDIEAPPGEPAVDILGEDATLAVTSSGSISAPDELNTAVVSSGEDALIINRGSISGGFNGISSSGDDLTLINTGTISSDSRAVDLTDGDGSRVVNAGSIIGTGDQRNGTLYVNGPVDDLRFLNTRQGVVDAGEGNLGDAISVQVGAEGDPSSEDINIANFGLLQGRGDGPDVFADGARVAANGSSGLRFFNGSGLDEATVSGSIFNAGTITAEVTLGFLGGIVVEDGVGFDGTIVNGRSGEIFAPFNGIYIGNAEHDLDIVNRGLISSGSRAVNLDGDNVTLNNSGTILGTGDQRNGTVYVDGTGDNISIFNQSSGVIDAGEGNLGDAISIQVGDVGDPGSEDINVVNFGLLQGRGDGPEVFADGARVAANGSSGLRFVNGSGLDEATVTGSIFNAGTITAEATLGFLGGVLVEDGVGFDGTIVNGRSGEIFAPFNGIYIGNAEHDLDIVNRGLIASDSRAVNLDGDNVTLNNSGTILGTGDQRNGTVYVDGTGDNISIFNQSSGVIDAGEGNLGDAISIQVGDVGDPGSEDINVVNFGLLQGRGDGPEVFADGARVAANGSSGLRFVNGSGLDEATVTGSIFNAGTITAEATLGFLGGVLVEDGVGFDGTITNAEGGDINGPQNGLYIGNAEHNLTINNEGLISSGSRAVNLDGDNVVLNNSGDILGTLNQRNGTIYIDGTGDDISINNFESGVIDAGGGFDGSGVSVQVGADGDVPDLVSENINIFNNGLIQGRGTESVPAGVRLFVGAGLAEATFIGNITNGEEGTISSETEAGILIEDGVIFDGTITNDGLISGGDGNAIDASGALGSVNIINNGELDGDVLLGQDNDTFTQNAPLTAVIDDSEDGSEASANFEVLVSGSEDDDDFSGDEAPAEDNDFDGDEDVVAPVAPILRIDGGAGIDTIDLSGQAAGIVIDLDLNTPPAGAESQDGAILDAPGGNVIAEVDDFENVIGTDFDDLILGNNEINVLEGGLGDDTIHSFAGADTVDGGEGVDTVLFTAGPGVTVDLDDDGNAIASVGDTLISIENINGSGTGDDDLSGNSSSNVLNGQGGNDILNGEGGADTLIGGTGDDTIISDGLDTVFGGDVVEPLAIFGEEPPASVDDGGIDTLDFSGLEEDVTGGAFNGVIVDLDVFTAGGTPTNGNTTPGLAGSTQFGAILDAPPAAGGAPVNGINVVDIENVVGSAFNDGLFGNNEVNVLEAEAGNDVVHGFAGDDFLAGGEGTDTVLFAAAPAGVVVDLNLQVSEADFDAIVDGDSPAIFAATGGAGNNVLSGFENVTGSASADNLIGDANDNALVGNGGDDTLLGGAGSDTLTGGLGADTFDFAGNLGLDVDTITDFSFAEDALDVSAFFADAGLALGAASQVGDNTVITLGNGSSAELLNVDVNDLSADNFIVGPLA